MMIDGIVIVNKFIIGYFSAFIFFQKNDPRKELSKITWLVKGLIILLFVALVYNVVSKRQIVSQTLMFPHQTYLAAAGVTLLVMITYLSKERKALAYKVMISVVIIMTLRAKALGFIAVYWMLYVYMFILRKKRVFGIGILGVVLAAYVGRKKIAEYFTRQTHFSPRYILLRDSVSLMFSSFPFGTGFGTFGSTIAAQYYSPVYTKLGYVLLDGMGLDGHTMYLSDSFWPCIVAQFGILGFICFIRFLYILCSSIIHRFKTQKKTAFCMAMIMVYLLIASIAETSFFNPAAFLLAMILGALKQSKDTGGIRVSGLDNVATRVA